MVASARSIVTARQLAPRATATALTKHASTALAPQRAVFVDCSNVVADMGSEKLTRRECAVLKIVDHARRLKLFKAWCGRCQCVAVRNQLCEFRASVVCPPACGPKSLITRHALDVAVVAHLQTFSPDDGMPVGLGLGAGPPCPCALGCWVDGVPPILTPTPRRVGSSVALQYSQLSSVVNRLSGAPQFGHFTCRPPIHQRRPPVSLLRSVPKVPGTG